MLKGTFVGGRALGWIFVGVVGLCWSRELLELSGSIASLIISHLQLQGRYSSGNLMCSDSAIVNSSQNYIAKTEQCSVHKMYTLHCNLQCYLVCAQNVVCLRIVDCQSVLCPKGEHFLSDELVQLHLCHTEKIQCCCVKQLRDSERREASTVELQITQLRGSWPGVETSWTHLAATVQLALFSGTPTSHQLPVSGS